MRLGLYVNPFARLRTEEATEPEPTTVAIWGELSGAQVILAGWCTGGGLLTERDLWMIRELVRTDLIIVVPLDDTIIEQVVKISPQGVILVDSRWDGLHPAAPINLTYDAESVTSIVQKYRAGGLPSLVLMEPDANQIKPLARTRAAGVVFDCIEYSRARNDEEALHAFEKIKDAAFAASKFDLIASAGHGLNYRNIGHISTIGNIEDIFVGSAIAARCVLVGMEKAIMELVQTIHRFRTSG